MSGIEKRHPANAALRARVDDILQKHQNIREALDQAERDTLALVRRPKPIQQSAPGHASGTDHLLQPDELQALRQVSDPDGQP
jgi:hypothetical protein